MWQSHSNTSLRLFGDKIGQLFKSQLAFSAKIQVLVAFLRNKLKSRYCVISKPDYPKRFQNRYVFKRDYDIHGNFVRNECFSINGRQTVLHRNETKRLTKNLKDLRNGVMEKNTKSNFFLKSAKIRQKQNHMITQTRQFQSAIVNNHAEHPAIMQVF